VEPIACNVYGNKIGTNITGTASLGIQAVGISFNGTKHTFLGGNNANEGNLISGNAFSGVQIAASVLVRGNKIGTDITGMYAVGNGPVSTSSYIADLGG